MELLVPAVVVLLLLGTPTALLVWSTWKLFSADADGKLKAVIGFSFLLLAVGLLVAFAVAVSWNDF